VQVDELFLVARGGDEVFQHLLCAGWFMVFHFAASAPLRIFTHVSSMFPHNCKPDYQH
jgi:hypothetical protein